MLATRPSIPVAGMCGNIAMPMQWPGMGQGKERELAGWQGTRKQKPRLFFETEKQRFLFVFVEAAEGKQEGLWEGSGHSGQGAVGGHAGTRHE